MESEVRRRGEKASALRQPRHVQDDATPPQKSHNRTRRRSVTPPRGAPINGELAHLHAVFEKVTKDLGDEKLEEAAPALLQVRRTYHRKGRGSHVSMFTCAV